MVFVVPVFEIKKGLDPPDTKFDLKAAIGRQEVRPFHNAVRRKMLLLTYFTFNLVLLVVPLAGRASEVARTADEFGRDADRIQRLLGQKLGALLHWSQGSKIDL